MAIILNRSKPARRLFALAILAASCGAFLGAEDSSWMRLEEGKISFGERKFGEALQVFNLAVADRNKDFIAYGEIFATVMSTRQAKRTGDSINGLLSRFAAEDLREGDMKNVEGESHGSLAKKLSAYENYRISDPFQNLVDVLQACLDFRSQDYFKDSLTAVKDFVDQRRFFPEAEYWIARVFIAEGEYEIAQKQLQKAISYSESLDVPEFVFEIRYLLADIHQTKKNLSAMERVYGDIIAQDGLYSKKTGVSLRQAMERSLKKDGIDKFLTLYRHDAFFAAKAYARLGEYYFLNGRYSPAVENLMLAADILTTKVLSGLMQENPDYRFSTVRELLATVDGSESLTAFSDESEYKKTLYYLGAALARIDEPRINQAREIFQELSGSKGPWAAMAAVQLRRPVTDMGKPEVNISK
jgi:tetratricopeptide (TPR) repeat protein